MGSCELVWSVTRSGMNASFTIRGSISAAFPVRPIEESLATSLCCLSHLNGRTHQASSSRYQRSAPGLKTALDSLRVDFDADAYPHLREFDRKGLRTTHSPKTGSDCDCARKRTTKVLLRRPAKCLIGSLQNSLSADVDPRTSRHLAIHHQSRSIESVELFPSGPPRHQIQSSRSALLRGQHY